MSRFLSSPLGRMFLLSLALYSMAAFLGFGASSAPGDGSSSATLQALVQVLAPLAKLEPPLMMLLVFLNNSIKALAVVVFGFTLGLVPFLFLVVNGLVTGLVVGEVAAQVGPAKTLAAVAPHGVIEIPALLLAAALSFRVARAVVRRMAGRPARPGREFKEGLGLYLKVVLPALLVAAAVEAFVTPLLIIR